MGFFPNIFKGSPTKIITNVLVPGLPLGVESFKAVAPLVKTAVQSVQSVAGTPPTNSSQSTSPYYIPGAPNSGPSPSYNVSYGAPTYGGGGQYDAFMLQPSVNPWGAPSWDSSTMYLTPSAPSFQVYSPPPQRQGATWEDLVGLALPFFL
jgi:hypothetical protein